MKRPGSILVLFISACVCASLLMGMAGNVAPGAQGTQSGPLLAFDAKLMDTDNNTVTLTSVNIDGKTAFQGLMGKGRITIPFDQIARIEMKGKAACIVLRNSQRLCNIIVKETSRIHGNTAFGLYQIALTDVAWVEISKSK